MRHTHGRVHTYRWTVNLYGFPFFEELTEMASGGPASGPASCAGLGL